MQRLQWVRQMQPELRKQTEIKKARAALSCTRFLFYCLHGGIVVGIQSQGQSVGNAVDAVGHEGH